MAPPSDLTTPIPQKNPDPSNNQDSSLRSNSAPSSISQRHKNDSAKPGATPQPSPSLPKKPALSTLPTPPKSDGAPALELDAAGNIKPPTNEPEKTTSAEDATLPPGHYEIRTMHQDLQRLRQGGPANPASIKTEAIKHLPKEGEGPPGTPTPHDHTTKTERSSTTIDPEQALKMPIAALLRKRTLFLIIGAAVALVAAASLWFFILQPTETTTPPIEIPPPVQTPPPSTEPQKHSMLSAAYPETAPTTIATNTEVITAVTSTSIATSLRSLLEKELPAGSITHIELRGALSANDVLTFTNIQLPDDLLTELQSTNPASPMLVIVATEEQKRLGLIVPLAKNGDRSTLHTALRAWEWRMDDDVAILFTGLTKGPPETTTFLDNRYNNTPLRYRNFTTPDVTVDYALIEASDPPFLFITTSRESLFHIIDLLRQ